MVRSWAILLRFLRLGLTAFGGPMAHLALFRDEFVTRGRVLNDQEFSKLVAIAQALPGPSSSQVGFAIGWRQGGWAGGLAAWIGFTLPAALVMGLAGAGLAQITAPAGMVTGALAAAVAAIAWATWGMRSLCPDPWRIMLMLLAVALTLSWAWGSLAAVAIGLAVGAIRKPIPGAGHQAPSPGTETQSSAEAAERDLHRERQAALGPKGPSSVARRWPTHALWLAPVLTATAIVALLAAAVIYPSPLLTTTAASAQAGALVVGGGHVVLPWLQDGLHGVLPANDLLTGYALVQVLPGPLFTLATYAGAAVAGFPGALLATVAVFAPGLVLMASCQGLGPWLAASRPASALAGGGAAVTGVLAATVAQAAAHAWSNQAPSLLLALAAMVALGCKFPVWLVVPMTVAGGWLAFA